MAQRLKASAARARGSDILHAIIVGGTLAGLGMFAYLIGGEGQKSSLRETALSGPKNSSGSKNLPGSKKKGEDLTTGAIVFEPIVGDDCRHKTIDNRTWEIEDHGVMPCKDAYEVSRGQRTGTSKRMDFIRDSFRK